MERYIPVSEYLDLSRTDPFVKGFVLDAGLRHQILDVIPLSDGRYELKTMRSPFRRNPDEHVLIVQREQRQKAKR